MRITTTDCFDISILVEQVELPKNPYKRYIWEVIDSPWIESLKRELKERDENATFMEKAHQYTLELDNVVEVVAGLSNNKE